MSSNVSNLASMRQETSKGKIEDFQWNTEIIECPASVLSMDCCCVLHCPCVQIATNRASLSGEYPGICDPCFSCPNTEYYTRRKLKDFGRMEENPAKDFITTLFCLPFTICQHSRELGLRKKQIEEAVVQEARGDKRMVKRVAEKQGFSTTAMHIATEAPEQTLANFAAWYAPELSERTEGGNEVYNDMQPYGQNMI